jgi:hypothetical protein
VVVLCIENGPAGLVMNPNVSRRRSLLLLPPRAPLIPSPIIEPIVIVIMVRLLLGQSMHLLLSSCPTGLSERRHIVPISVLEPGATPNALLIDENITEEGLAWPE